MKLRIIIPVVIGILVSIYLVINIIVNGLSAIYLPLGVIALCALPYSLYLASRGSVLFAYSSLQLPIPLAPQLGQIFGFLTIPGLIIGGVSKKLKKEKYFSQFTLGSLVILSALYIVSMVVNYIFLDEPATKLLTNVGGRNYIKQFLAIVSPLAIIYAKINITDIKKILRLGWLLAVTYLVTDIFLYVAPGALGPILLFFQTPNDFKNFYGQSEEGLFRFAGAGYAGIGIGLFILSFKRRNDRLLKTLLIELGIVAMILVCALSGSRRLIVVLPFALCVVIIINRQLSLLRLLPYIVLLIGFLVTAFVTYERLPSGIQRALFVIPGIAGDSGIDFRDTRANDMGRDIIQDTVIEKIIPSNYATGVGFLREGVLYDFKDSYQRNEYLLGNKVFYAGHLSLLAQLGILGYIASVGLMLLMLYLSVKHIFYFRKVGDGFGVFAGAAASYAIYKVLYYAFQHGNGFAFFTTLYPPFLSLLYVEKCIAQLREMQVKHQINKNQMQYARDKLASASKIELS